MEEYNKKKNIEVLEESSTNNNSKQKNKLKHVDFNIFPCLLFYSFSFLKNLKRVKKKEKNENNQLAVAKYILSGKVSNILIYNN